MGFAEEGSLKAVTTARSSDQVSSISFAAAIGVLEEANGNTDMVKKISQVIEELQNVIRLRRRGISKLLYADNLATCTARRKKQLVTTAKIMTPKKRTTTSPPATTTTTTTPITEDQLKALIAQGVADVVAERDATRSRNGEDA
ncbi:hypothetical protein Tco_1080861 [Tanacetum coccineum]|uniref:Uncharacterized protein n=1 Tax=Tanacetum coccineum TaxID=301880 RepID=A0ABQ5HVZ3_9ASTR